MKKILDAKAKSVSAAAAVTPPFLKRKAMRQVINTAGVAVSLKNKINSDYKNATSVLNVGYFGMACVSLVCIYVYYKKTLTHKNSDKEEEFLCM